MAGLTFSKIIFGILIVGVIFTGFVKFGGEIQANSNLDITTHFATIQFLNFFVL